MSHLAVSAHTDPVNGLVSSAYERRRLPEDHDLVEMSQGTNQESDLEIDLDMDTDIDLDNENGESLSSALPSSQVDSDVDFDMNFDADFDSASADDLSSDFDESSVFDDTINHDFSAPFGDLSFIKLLLEKLRLDYGNARSTRGPDFEFKHIQAREAFGRFVLMRLHLNGNHFPLWASAYYGGSNPFLTEILRASAQWGIQSEDYTPLTFALDRLPTNAFKVGLGLIVAGTPIPTSPDGVVALSEACKNGFAKIASILVEHGAEISGPTFLQNAVSNSCISSGPRHLETLRVLVEIISQHEGVKLQCSSALIQAALDQNSDTFELLVKLYLDDPTVLTLACLCGSIPSVCLLRAYGHDLNAPNASGDLPLHGLFKSLNGDMTKLLYF